MHRMDLAIGKDLFLDGVKKVRGYSLGRILCSYRDTDERTVELEQEMFSRAHLEAGLATKRLF